MNPTIDFEDPQLVSRYRSWVGVLTAFHDFIWRNIPEQFIENPKSAWEAFVRDETLLDDPEKK